MKATGQITYDSFEELCYRGEHTLRKHMIKGAFAMFCLFQVAAIISFVFLIISLVAIPIETQEDLNAAIAMTLIAVICEIVSFIMRFICLYYRNTVTLYYENYIQIKNMAKRMYLFGMMSWDGWYKRTGYTFVRESLKFTYEVVN